MKHTPGPWKACAFSSVVGCPITAQPDPNASTIVVAGTRSAMAADSEGFRQEVEANARLIAAAPYLLQFAQAVIESIERDGKPSPGMRWHTEYLSAKALIAEIEGGAA